MGAYCEWHGKWVKDLTEHEVAECWGAAGMFCTRCTEITWRCKEVETVLNTAGDIMTIRELKCMIAFLELRVMALSRLNPHRKKLLALMHEIREQLKTAEERKMAERDTIDMIRSWLEKRLEEKELMLRVERHWMEELVTLLCEIKQD